MGKKDFCLMWGDDHIRQTSFAYGKPLPLLCEAPAGIPLFTLSAG